MTKTMEEAAKEYAAQVDKNIEELYGIQQPTSLTFGECAAEAFRAGAERMREYIFQIYDDCGGDMDFVKWMLNRDEDE